jgi:hypothetical protein
MYIGSGILDQGQNVLDLIKEKKNARIYIEETKPGAHLLMPKK